MIKPLIPQINWNNPLTRELVFDMPFFDRGGTSPTDIVNMRGSTTSNTTWGTDIYGPTMVFASASSSKVTTNFTTHNAQRSYEVFLKRTGTGGSGLGRIFDKRTASAQAELWFYNNPWEYDRQATGQGAWKFSDNIGTGVWQHLVLTYDNSALANDPIMYCNATSLSRILDQNPTGTFVTNTDPYVIGNRGNDNARGWDGSMAYFRIWNRILDPTEVRQLYQRPFGIYKGIGAYQSLDTAGVAAVYASMRMMTGMGI